MDSIFCPWCGHEHKATWQMGDWGDTNCVKCGKRFWYEQETYVAYETGKGSVFEKEEDDD